MVSAEAWRGPNAERCHETAEDGLRYHHDAHGQRWAAVFRLARRPGCGGAALVRHLGDLRLHRTSCVDTSQIRWRVAIAAHLPAHPAPGAAAATRCRRAADAACRTIGAAGARIRAWGKTGA